MISSIKAASRDFLRKNGKTDILGVLWLLHVQEDFRSASLASVIAGELGIFGHKPAVANDILAGKRVEIKPSEGAFWRSFSGDQSPEDIETALQLVYQLFTSR
eukprot:scaffold618240_cov17-Prasinocladus_malaysianus.AAC.1